MLSHTPRSADRLAGTAPPRVSGSRARTWYQDPEVYDGFEVDRIRYVKQILDTSAQR